MGRLGYVILNCCRAEWAKNVPNAAVLLSTRWKGAVTTSQQHYKHYEETLLLEDWTYTRRTGRRIKFAGPLLMKQCRGMLDIRWEGTAATNASSLSVVSGRSKRRHC